MRSARRRQRDTAAAGPGGRRADRCDRPEHLFQRFGRLDVLVHNAGALGRLTPVAHILPNDWADVIAVNLTAAWRLIRTCDPLLRNAAGRPRGVRHRRAARATPKAYWGAYRCDQGGDGAPRADLGRRGANDAPAGEPVRSRCRRNTAPRERFSGRGARFAGAATRGRAATGRPLLPRRTAPWRLLHCRGTAPQEPLVPHLAVNREAVFAKATAVISYRHAGRR